MISKRLTCIPFSSAHYEVFISWITDPYFLMQFAGPRLTYPVDRAQLDRFYDDPNRFPFHVLDRTSGQGIGHGEVLCKEESILIGQVMLAEEKNRGHGLGKELIRLLVDESFTRWDKPVVELHVYDWNLAAIRCYEQIGFKRNTGAQNIVDIGDQQWTAIHMQLARADYQPDRRPVTL